MHSEGVYTITDENLTVLVKPNVFSVTNLIMYVRRIFSHFNVLFYIINLTLILSLRKSAKSFKNNCLLLSILMPP